MDCIELGDTVVGVSCAALGKMLVGKSDGL